MEDNKSELESLTDSNSQDSDAEKFGKRPDWVRLISTGTIVLLYVIVHIAWARSSTWKDNLCGPSGTFFITSYRNHLLFYPLPESTNFPPFSIRCQSSSQWISWPYLQISPYSSALHPRILENVQTGHTLGGMFGRGILLPHWMVAGSLIALLVVSRVRRSFSFRAFLVIVTMISVTLAYGVRSDGWSNLIRASKSIQPGDSVSEVRAILGAGTKTRGYRHLFARRPLAFHSLLEPNLILKADEIPTERGVDEAHFYRKDHVNGLVLFFRDGSLVEAFEYGPSDSGD